MNVLYYDKSERGGIYRIINLENGRLYIGSTNCFRKRFKSHLTALSSNRHINTFLQNDWNKTGAEKFIFEVIEAVEKTDQLLEREQYFIDQYYDNQKRCYNLRKDACESREGKKNIFVTDPLTDKRCRPKTKERKHEISKTLKKVFADPQMKEKRSESTKKRWQESSPLIGTVLINLATKERVILDKSLKVWAEEKNLSYKSLHLLIKGKVKTSGGWYVEGTNPEHVSQKGQVRKPLSSAHREKISKGIYFGKKVVSPEDDIISLPTNLKQFCRDNNLPYTTFVKLLRNECKTCLGWKRHEQDASYTKV